MILQVTSHFRQPILRASAFLGDIFFPQEGIWGGGTGTKKHTNISASSSQKIVSIIGKNYAEFQDQLLNCVVEA